MCDDMNCGHTDDLDLAAQAAEDAAAFLERTPFVPDYEPTQGTRVHRQALVAGDGGVATVTFHGGVRSAWIQTGPHSGRMSLYAEVNVLDTDDTTFRVALVPTGKRVPMGASRIGSGGRLHAYLLETTRTACGPHGRSQPTEALAAAEVPETPDAVSVDGDDGDTNGA